MTLQELLKKDFRISLPISGGFGNSLENAIIIHREGINDYVGTEHIILECLGIGRRIQWKKLGQELLTQNNKIIDKIKIETKQLTETEEISQIENYYFDITECFKRQVNQDSPFDEEMTLRKLKERIIELEGLNEFNKKCIALLKTEKLFIDISLTLEFLEVINMDESFPLFKKMMEHTKRPLLVVLRRVGKELNENQS
ncbi:MAG: hypothetical protein IPM34_01810 [Saprospiraceae bacterium]|nr:hypothetical protein [Saprospiraceae bacterium]